MTKLNNDNLNMNRVLCEMFEIPPDAIGATIRLRAGEIPTMTVRRLIYRTGQLAPGATSARFEIVQKKPSNAPNSADAKRSAGMTG